MTNSLFRLVLSMLLGGAVGAERKRKGQIAGIRTFTLISMGACLAMLLSIYVPQVYLGLKNGDPGRIAAQVITGIGFIGGGAMLVAFEHYEKKRRLGQESKVIGMTVSGILEDMEAYRKVFRENGVHLSTFYIEYDYERNLTEVNFVVLAHAYTDLLPLLRSIGHVGETRKLTLSSQIDI